MNHGRREARIDHERSAPAIHRPVHEQMISKSSLKPRFAETFRTEQAVERFRRHGNATKRDANAEADLGNHGSPFVRVPQIQTHSADIDYGEVKRQMLNPEQSG